MRAREGREYEWPADQVERWPIDRLIPYAKNSRTHSEAQIAQLAASMKEWSWTNPVLADEAGGVIAGHARILAARQLGYAEVPVMVARGWSDAQKRAYVIADNQLALNAGWDRELHPVSRAGDLWLLGRHRLLCGNRCCETAGRLTGRPSAITVTGRPAKGRVERANKTLQDRLVKELRLAGAATLAEGNALLPAFMADYNARFAKAPANRKDLHRRLGPGDDLDDAFAWKEERTLSRALTLQYDKVLFILEPSEPAKAAIGKRVSVVDHPDGRLSIRYNGVELAYRTFDKVRHVDQGAIADNKQLGAVLAMIRDEQLRRGPERRSGPRRRDQRDPRLFKVG
jgi:hypothetical protein